jgi:hypothetical protein
MGPCQDTHLHATIIGNLKDVEDEEAASEEEAWALVGWALALGAAVL